MEALMTIGVEGGTGMLRCCDVTHRDEAAR